jgi:serine/threonine protein phosphatase PrpC
MFAEFLTLYDINRWLRYVTWMGLVCAGVFFLLSDGGLPPSSWLSFIQTLLTLPTLWALNSTSSFWRLTGSLAWSLVWGGLWYLLFYCGSMLIRHHLRSTSTSAVQMREAAASWLPSPPLALALSPSGLSSDTHISTAPRLRLPQRPPSGNHSQAASLTTSRPHTRLELADLPTRPAGSMHRTVSNEPPAMRVLPLRVGVGWHPGVTRRHYPNEDSVVVMQGSYTYRNQLLPFGLFVVADGMGGHEDGQVASRMAIQTVSHTVLQNIIMGRELSDEFFTDMLVGGVEWANLAIYQRGKADGIDMGTTLTAVLVINMRAYIVNVGDSRTYLFRDSAGLIQITHDHSLVASLVAFGQITPDEVYTHPDRSQIYRSLGQIEDLKVDSFKVDLEPHDRLLLCSDGLWEMIRDPAIERIIRSSDDPLLLSDRLVQTALRGGGSDNISVVIAQI